jgi:hypothetical protein
MDNREAALRCELAAAIKHRKEAEAVANEAKARLDRGKTLQEQVEAEVNTLENSQREFHSKCEQDRTFAILANLEHEHAGDIGDVVTLGSPTIDTAALISAKDKASACRNAVAKLNADFSDANDKANRATQACETLVEAIIFITGMPQMKL